MSLDRIKQLKSDREILEQEVNELQSQLGESFANADDAKQRKKLISMLESKRIEVTGIDSAIGMLQERAFQEEIDRYVDQYLDAGEKIPTLQSEIQELEAEIAKVKPLQKRLRELQADVERLGRHRNELVTHAAHKHRITQAAFLAHAKLRQSERKLIQE